MTVGKAQRLPCQRPDALIGKQNGGGGHHLGHLTAVSAGVHAHRAAHAAGNAVGKLQAGEPQPAGGHGHTGQGRAGIGAETAGVAFHARHPVHIPGVDHKAVHPGVREQEVRAVAQDNGPGGQLPGAAEQQDELLAVLRKGHAAGRAADAE